MEMPQGWPDASCALAWPLRAATREGRARLGAVPLQHSGVPSWAIGPFGSHAAKAVGNVAGRWQAELGPSLERTRRPTPCAGWVWSALAKNWSTPRGPGARAAPGRGLVGCRPIAYSHLPLREHLSVSKVLTPGVFCIKRAPGPALARAGGRRLAGAYGASGLPPSWRLRQQSGGASKKGRIRGTSPQARVTLKKDRPACGRAPPRTWATTSRSNQPPSRGWCRTTWARRGDRGSAGDV